MVNFTVTNLNDSGAGSLRQAILDANLNPGNDVISFAVTGSINLLSDLPEIIDNVTIDGTTAPGFDGRPLVAINFNNNTGFKFTSSGGNSAAGSQVLGLAIFGSSTNGITVEVDNIIIQGNYIGVDLDGQTARGNQGDGIFLGTQTSQHLIGTTSSASGQFQLSNVISGNQGNGIRLAGSSNNRISMNYIGTDVTGQIKLGNGLNGILVTQGSRDNFIGGFETGGNNPVDAGPFGDGSPVKFVVPPQGNLISGNTGNGVLIDQQSEFNTLAGNFIGTVADGNSALGNGADGVAINEADNNFLLGTTVSQNPFVFYNVVSGNGGNGLRLTNADNTIVHANFFGAGANNATIVSNGLNGVMVEGTSRDTRFGSIIPLGNVTSGNTLNGVEVKDEVTGFTSFNTFSGLFAFSTIAPNGQDGILITSTGGNNTLRTNAFSGNVRHGIHLTGNATGVTIDPNIAGTSTFGDSPLPNGGHGVLIGGNANNNFIGGFQSQTPSALPINLFSANKGYGLVIADRAHNNTVINSQIGGGFNTDLPLGNGLGGLLITDQAFNNIIGGAPSPELPDNDPQVIAINNNGFGFTVNTTGTGNQLINNFSQGNDSDGFAIVGSGGNNLTGNESQTNQGYGYSFLNSPSTNNTFNNNQGVDNNLGETQIANGWINGLVSQAVGANSFSLTQTTDLTVARTDSAGGTFTFGLTNGTVSLTVLSDAQASSANVLTVDKVYSDDPSSNWFTSEGQAFGTTAVQSIDTGTWTPFAQDSSGNQLALASLSVEGNNATATFAGGITASFSLPNTGTNTNFAGQSAPLTVRRLAGNENGLAFYRTDDLTGAVNGLLPGQSGYLAAAFTQAQNEGLVFSAAQLPAFQGTQGFALGLDSTANYGVLLLPQDNINAAFSSYSAANPGGAAQFQTFGSMGGRLTIGIEDIAVNSGLSDRDYNDLILTLAADNIGVI
ncbi:right-handed parallel beta-helix repeat-containing protein [Synechocystis sp. FACHB-383]|uniref:beta strand repeat-containing protein n=1 Tax=Synechocystis sp. FACHB-383 TaxID=2692864 RepID=UPI001688F0A5|nr:right-handed parallel beta-helix repeat-containing protein [Synechocystis sp. FACHB-383]MBD2651965.1 right-handed parallel beta-helix repeat-containing protein [Synechocystis sp. FACHB-383]